MRFLGILTGILFFYLLLTRPRFLRAGPYFVALNQDRASRDAWERDYREAMDDVE